MAISSNIAQLNDRLRQHGLGGHVMVTQGIQALSEAQQKAVLQAVRDFDSFTDDNDPYAEHDFGALIVEGHSIMWKIDAYDKEMMFASPDPADPKQTTRVLTIMLAEEY